MSPQQQQDLQAIGSRWVLNQLKYRTFTETLAFSAEVAAQLSGDLDEAHAVYAGMKAELRRCRPTELTRHDLLDRFDALQCRLTDLRDDTLMLS